MRCSWACIGVPSTSLKAAMTVGDAGVDGRLERPQVQVAQGVLADADRVVVAAAGGEAVAGEVLGARGEPVGVARVVALEAAHERGGEAAREHRRLAERLGDPAPARLLGDVDHRGERPRDPVDGGLAGRDRARPPRRGRGRRRPRGRAGSGTTVRWPWMTSRPKSSGMPRRLPSTAWRWAASMLPTRTPSSRSLPPVAPERVEARADAAGARSLGVGLGVDVGDLVGLADLLGQGHLGHEQVDALLDGQRGIEPRPLGRAWRWRSHVSGSPRDLGGGRAVAVASVGEPSSRSAARDGHPRPR